MLCMPALNVVTEKIPYNNKEPSFDICGFLFVTMGQQIWYKMTNKKSPHVRE